jgi:hypothetical protein
MLFKMSKIIILIMYDYYCLGKVRRKKQSVSGNDIKEISLFMKELTQIERYLNHYNSNALCDEVDFAKKITLYLFMKNQKGFY